MKVCPVCASTLFDDMPTCFSCLYQFGSDEIIDTQLAFEGVGTPGNAVREMELPGWVIRVRAEGPGARQTALTIEIEPT